MLCLQSASDGFWKSVATRVPKEPPEIRILNPYFIQEAAFTLIGLPFNNGLMGRGVRLRGREEENLAGEPWKGNGWGRRLRGGGGGGEVPSLEMGQLALEVSATPTHPAELYTPPSALLFQNIPTLGSVAVTMALHGCDEVAVAGFGYDMNTPNAPLHYYETVRMAAIQEVRAGRGGSLWVEPGGGASGARDGLQHLYK